MRDDDKVPREGEIAIEQVAKELWQMVDKLGRLPSPRLASPRALLQGFEPSGPGRDSSRR